jgi:hypothetical protein
MVIVFWGLVASAVVGSLVWSKIRTRRRLRSLTGNQVPSASEITQATNARHRSNYEIERAHMANTSIIGPFGGPS